MSPTTGLLSKKEFSELWKDSRPTLLFVEEGQTRGQLKASSAYNDAIDRITFDHYERKKLAVLVHDVVAHLPVDHFKLWGRIRLRIVGLLCPGFSAHFHRLAALADYHERNLEPLLKQ